MQVIDNNKTTKRISRQTTPVKFAFISIRAPLTKKQYPRRLKLFFDHIVIRGENIEEQAQPFLAKAKTELEYWIEENIQLYLTIKRTGS